MVLMKQFLFEQLAEIGKALSHANRLMILDVLAQGPCDVDLLSHKLGLTVANVSKHLQQLNRVGLVSFEKQGAQRLYRLTHDDVVRLIGMMRSMAETHLNEVSDVLINHLSSKAPLTPVSVRHLQQAVRKQEVTLLDLRPKDEYLAGHMEGAVNAPMDEMNQWFPRLLQQEIESKPVVVYCRGPYCLWSYEVVEKLREQGVNASRMAQGYVDLKVQGL